MSESSFARAFRLAFPLPFCAVGIVALAAAARKLARVEPAGEVAMLALFGAVFAAAGFGMIALFSWTRRRAAGAAELRRRRPDAPWLWRPDWAAGRIPGSGRARLGVAWTFAFFWNALSAPAVPEAARRLERGFEAEILALLLFPAIGVAMLVWAVRATLRWRRYGTAHFVPDAVPAPVGGRLSGTIVAADRLRPETVELTLSCVLQTVRGSGKSRSVQESILFREDRRLDRFDMSVGGGETRIPVAFDLPRDARPTDPEESASRVLWRLAARADTPGVDWATDFEVPVFRTAESDRADAAAQAAAADGRTDAGAAAAPEPPAERRSRVRVERTPDGLEVVFPAGRNVAAILGLMAFASVWTGLVVLLATRGAGTVFTLVFGLFDLLLLFLLSQMLFLQHAVRVGPTDVEVRTRWLLFSRTRRVELDALSAVRTRIGMQSHKRPYYDVVLVLLDGTRVTAGCAMADKAEAEWIAGTLREAAGLLRRDDGPRRARKPRRVEPDAPGALGDVSRTA